MSVVSTSEERNNAEGNFDTLARIEADHDKAQEGVTRAGAGERERKT
jgi:hypothetical protein